LCHEQNKQMRMIAAVASEPALTFEAAVAFELASHNFEMVNFNEDFHCLINDISKFSHNQGGWKSEQLFHRNSINSPFPYRSQKHFKLTRHCTDQSHFRFD
jgi:hypothetical protein